MSSVGLGPLLAPCQSPPGLCPGGHAPSMHPFRLWPISPSPHHAAGLTHGLPNGPVWDSILPIRLRPGGHSGPTALTGSKSSASGSRGEAGEASHAQDGQPPPPTNPPSQVSSSGKQG